jgi:hypothetical protein
VEPTGTLNADLEYRQARSGRRKPRKKREKYDSKTQQRNIPAPTRLVGEGHLSATGNVVRQYTLPVHVTIAEVRCIRSRERAPVFQPRATQKKKQSGDQTRKTKNTMCARKGTSQGGSSSSDQAQQRANVHREQSHSCEDRSRDNSSTLNHLHHHHTHHARA